MDPIQSSAPETSGSSTDLLRSDLHAKYLPLVAEACLKEFSADKGGSGYLKGYLHKISQSDPTIKFNPERFDEVIAAGKLEGFIETLSPFKFSHLIGMDTGWNFGNIDSVDFANFAKSLKPFYKVTFGSDSKAVVTPLDQDTVWGNGGLDRTKPFVVINPGIGPVSQKWQAANSGALEKEFEEKVVSEVKNFEKGVKKFGVSEERQYLVTVNEDLGKNAEAAKDLIRRHNANPAGFTTDYAKEQTRLLYGPLITENGVVSDGSGHSSGARLLDKQIVANLSKARSFNPSLGTVTANCQTNALVAMMRDLGISPEVIKDGIENMRRLDAPNMAVTNPGISPSTVTFEGSNDLMAKDFIGGRIPVLPADHVHTSVVPIDDHRIKVYQKLPEEVYNPSKKSTEEQRREEDKIVRVPTIFEQMLPPERNQENEIASVSTILKQKQMLPPKFINQDPKERKERVLELMGLDGLRYRDPNVHMSPHISMPATPGNEVVGRDPDLLYKLMADMLTRENPRNVSHYFEQQQERTLSALDLAATDQQIKPFRESNDVVVKGFAEKIRPSKSRSDDGQSAVGDFAKNSSFVDRVRSEAGKQTGASKER